MESINLEENFKKSDRKKVSFLRYKIVELPKKYVELHDTPCIAYFLNAKLVTEQIEAIKYIFYNFEIEGIQFLADLYFDAPLNHPTRNQIYKIFLKSSNNDEVVKSLSNSVKSLIEEHNTDIKCSETNGLIASLASCFENFPQAKQATKLQFRIFFPFLCSTLEIYLDYLNNESSPSLRNEYYSYLHNSIRVILSCFQEFSPNIKIFIENINNVKEIAEKLLESDNVPLDTTTNLGILLAQIAKCFDYSLEYIARISVSSNQNSSLTLCKCVGIIYTFAFKNDEISSNDITNIIKKITNIGVMSSTEMPIHLIATRCLQQVSKELILLETVNSQQEEIFKILLNYAHLFLEHNVENIRYMCRDMLKNIAIIVKKNGANNIMTDFLNDSLKQDSNSMKCIVLSNICNELDYKKLFLEYPNFFKDLFGKNFGKDLVVTTCYERLMIASYKQFEFTEWNNIWINYLVDLLCEEDINNLEYFENILNKAIVTDALVAESVLNENCNLQLRTKLSILWTIRKNGLKIQNFESILNDHQKHFSKVFLSNCDDTKILVLKLIVETHKSTEFMTEIECENILFYLKYNANCQSPSIRYKALVLIRKSFTRVEVNLVKILKTKKANEHFYLKFFKNLFKLFIDNLFVGANLSRKLISLSLLKYLIQIIINNNLNVSEFLPENGPKNLLAIINDPCEGNKSLAVEILNLLRIYVNVEDSLVFIENLLISSKPKDFISAIYHIEHNCNHLNNPNEAQKFFNLTCDIPNMQFTYYCAIKWCKQILVNGIELAEKSILLTAKLNPLYGSLGTIRYIILKLDFELISNDNLWRSLLKELIETCKCCIEIVRPIITSASPEGYIPPNMYEITTEKTVKLEEKITPQMILICAWRTIKEVCIILGDIVARAPIENNKHQTNFILKLSEVFDIGEYFKVLLLESKHRGAFEQTYVGFLKLTTSLWKSEQRELNSLPMKWMRELIDIITLNVKEIEKMSATRRSAGIPYMMQALIASELRVGSTKALDLCMNKFQNLCTESNINNIDCKTHAYNIMRALYRCTTLSDVVTEYIANGVICAIRGYNSKTWSEKNSATLLFSALMVRIFGVQETRESDEIDIRNKMTGKMFFLRYPRLYDFFLHELKIASIAIHNNQNAPTLHPLLLVLCRLYPTALEGTSSNLKIGNFLPYLSECSASPEMHTRVLVAKAITAIILREEIPIKIIKIIDICKNTLGSLSSNYLHGYLLQVQNLLKSLVHVPAEIFANIFCDIDCESKQIQRNKVIFNTILEIRIDLLQKLNSTTDYDKFHSLNLDVLNYDDAESFYYPVFRKTLLIYNLHVMRLTQTHVKLICFLMCMNLEEQSFELIETTLNIILLIISRKNKTQIDLDDLEITEFELNLINNLRNIDELFALLIASEKLEKFLKYIVRAKILHNCTIKAYQILSGISADKLDLEELIQESNENHEDVKLSIAACVKSVISYQDFSQEIPEKHKYILDYIEDISNSQSVLLRFQASEILLQWSKYFWFYLKEKHIELTVSFACIAFKFLMDDKFHIRNEAAKIIQTINVFKSISNTITIASTYAQELFIENIAYTLKNDYFNKDDEYIREIFIKIINRQSIECNIFDTDLSDDDIFDKNDVNVYDETAKIIADCKFFYFQYFNRDI